MLNFTCLQMIAGGLFQCLMSIFNQAWEKVDPAGISPVSIAAVIYLILFGSIVAFSCYLWLLGQVSAQKVTTYALVNPVVALLLGFIVLGERITAVTLVAATLVLAGVALVFFQGTASESKAHVSESTL